MTRLDTTVMSAIDPRLQIGEDKMDHRQVLLCLLWVAPKRKNIVPIAHSGKVIISLPAIRADNGSRGHVVTDESGKRFDVATRKRRLHLFDAGDDAEPKTPGISQFFDWDATFVGIPPFRAARLGVLSCPHLDRANYCRLMMGALTFPARAATYEAFVYLDGIRRPDGISVWPHHARTEFVKHRERCLIGSDIKLTLKLNGGLAGRLRRHKIGAPKPSREGHVARLHDRPGGKGRIFLTGAATQHDRRARCETVRLASMPARLAREAIRPAHRLQVTGASAVIRENALKFGKACWEGCVHV